LFLSLGQGLLIQVDGAFLPFLLSLSRELGNSKLYSSIIDYFYGGLPLSDLFRPDCIDLCSESVINDISSQLYLLDPSSLDQIPLATLSEILSRDSLQLFSENWLFRCISSRISIDSDYSQLLRFVRFEYIWSDCICDFVCSEAMVIFLWNAISMRFLLFSAAPPVVQIQCPFQCDTLLNGVISYLTKTHGGNVQDTGIVSITTKSRPFPVPFQAPRHVAYFNSINSIVSMDGPDQWICWDFLERRVRLTHYCINRPDATVTKSWIVESSLDGVECDLAFPVSSSSEFRFIGLTQAAPNASGSYIMVVNAFEVFGTLVERESVSDC
jgi:hypothetical protein